MQTTARNELTGKITAIIDGTVMSEVKIEVAPSILVSATVTKEGMDSLGLKVGDTVTALIKASSVILSNKQLKATARNILKGTVNEVLKGAVNSEVKLSLGSNIICAVVTNEAIEDLSIKASQEAYAIFKASSVILVG
ncbi:MAG: TOBE domain-containing protein [Candidatus Marinarcus sp.]|uniref:TOBE domain-containing protein n=1 Tax=Candidatus Marinarcus sp. TaxID=3100987 RepID=UPI003AFFF603